jgi:hypothetical protein
MQVNKNIKNFINYFLGPLLFAWLVFSITRHLLHQPHLETSWKQVKDSFQSPRVFYFVFAVLLVFVNWGIEAWKWRLSVNTVHPVSFLQAYKAVLSGVSFSVTMPNRIGEYLGRIMYLPEGNRLKTIPVTLVGSFAQLMVTLAMGTAGVWILKKKIIAEEGSFLIWHQFIGYGLIALCLILLLLYFRVSGSAVLFRRWVRNEKYNYLVEALGSFHMQLLAQILLLSFLRYLVFMVQYILLFKLFGVGVPALTIVWVMSIVFLAMAVIPSIALVELGLRGEISLKLMGLYTSNVLGVTLTTVSVWFINLILPAIIGSLLILNLRVFGRRAKRS